MSHDDHFADEPREIPVRHHAQPDAPEGAGQADPPGPEDDSEPVVLHPERHEQLVTAEQERDDYLGRLQRAVADGQNLRKRFDRMRETAQRDAKRDAALRFIPLADGLARAREAAESAEGAEGLAQGVRLVEKEFYDILAAMGVTPVESVGEPFDPHYHEAVMQQFVEGVEPGTVVTEFKKGFVMGDSLVRAAQVIVAAAPAVPGERTE